MIHSAITPDDATAEGRVFVNTYADVLNRFAQQHTVTVATGATCAYLGDERNLREYLVADEIVRWLRRAGHIVNFLLIDDSMDPLNFRQLRVALNKDETLIERYQHWCGRPISQLPDPFGCHESYAEHFEDQLLARLNRLGCHPTLVTTARLYERERYAPYVHLILQRYKEVLEFLQHKFPTYQPEKLFWVLCPQCRYIDKTQIMDAHDGHVVVHCERCGRTNSLPIADVQGKLNWKIDCAVRWVLLDVDIEPFAKAYLEPDVGTFFIAREIANHFFGGTKVVPFQYGSVLMEKQWSYKLLDAAPPEMLREMMVSRPASDIRISRDMMVTAASRHLVSPGLTYLDFVKQLLPMWLLTPDKLSARERDFVSHGMAFGRDFLGTEARLHLPSRVEIEGERREVLRAIHSLLSHTVQIRNAEGSEWEGFEKATKEFLSTLGPLKGPALHRLRLIVGQQQGLPAIRFLFALPLDYLVMVEFLIHLYLQSSLTAANQHAA